MTQWRMSLIKSYQPHRPGGGDPTCSTAGLVLYQNKHLQFFSQKEAGLAGILKLKHAKRYQQKRMQSAHLLKGSEFCAVIFIECLTYKKNHERLLKHIQMNRNMPQFINMELKIYDIYAYMHIHICVGSSYNFIRF